MEPSLDSDATFDPVNFSFPHGTHLCAAEVDTETGMVTIRSYVAVDDCGKVINPLIVEGQVHGGIAQGIAQALYEEGVYDDDGNLVTTTLADYLIPSAAHRWVPCGKEKLAGSKVASESSDGSMPSGMLCAANVASASSGME